MMSESKRADGDRPGGSLVLREESPPGLADLVRAVPGVARIAASVGRRTAARAVDASAYTASRLRAVARGEPTSAVVQETAADLRAYARELLGLSGGEGDGSGAEPRLPAEYAGAASPDALRRRGSELLRLSGDIRYEEASHPAYMRILDALSPDEGRILRFLAQQGPQPSVDVRAGLPLASELIEPGCSMISAEAGCRHSDRVHAYLDNLHRLGLIWFSREPVKDRARYQVLEAQPEVTEARARGGRTSRTVRRSILLTPFGEDFCAVCLPL